MFKDDFEQLNNDLIQLSADYKDLCKNIGKVVQEAEIEIWIKAATYAKYRAKQDNFYESGYTVGEDISEWCMKQARRKK